MILVSLEIMLALWFCILLLLVAFFIQLGEGGEAQNPCERVERCGYQDIKFPFRLKGRHPDHCGYPGFELSCTEKRQTVLELPNIPTKFYVDWIDYENQELEFYDPENCTLTNIHLPVSPFYFNETNIIFFLLNCSTLERKKHSDKYFGMITCLSGPTYQIYVVDSAGYFLDELPIVQCSVVDKKTLYFPSSLIWFEPNCTLCERNKKSCRLKSNGTGTETECFLPVIQGKNESRKFVASGELFSWNFQVSISLMSRKFGSLLSFGSR
ncbi:hypothetical protein FEM48_Zijuj03G0174000 [Ziziphus jujuba var. spinosa]|uniref:RING-type E3 ubiquitin transferase n=1 Tax=Ziziphus jujuba var. spinosa TaxID=714518 RepID=A0A978VRM8_ZIZJJ|nr:hypothetical protein FEM48_Zijuj03G0174000 [Ziziphus jujuba var. spinosa]